MDRTYYKVCVLCVCLLLQDLVHVCVVCVVYYCSTYYKAVRVYFVCLLLQYLLQSCFITAGFIGPSTKYKP